MQCRNKHISSANKMRVRKCIRCGKTPQQTSFPTHPNTWDKLGSSCKQCNSSSQQKRWKTITPEQVADRKVRYDSDLYREQRLLRKYDLAIDAYKEILLLQEEKCPICMNELPDYSKVAVDHNHATGEVRGLLHHKCNLAIGKFRDNSEFISLALSYISNKVEPPTLLFREGEQFADNRLSREFQISIEGKQRWIDYLGNMCQCCGNQFGSSRFIHIDHHHERNELRGLICSNCNQGLGLFDEDVSTMLRAIRYLEDPPNLSPNFILGAE